MTEMTNIVELSNRRFAVVDMDTGTVLGTNVCLVPWPTDPHEADEVLSSDSACFDYATEYGIPLYADVE